MGDRDLAWYQMAYPKACDALDDERAEVRRLHTALDAATAQLTDRDDDFRKVVSGACAPDEHHCSCVPHLRRALNTATRRANTEAVRADMAQRKITELQAEIDAATRERDEALTKPRAIMDEHLDRVVAGAKAAEREAVVVWLRSTNRNTAADAIERGEHTKEGEGNG